MRRLAVLVTAMVLALLATGPTAAADVRPLPTGTRADYQLGGDRDVPAEVGIVVRDRTGSPEAGRYNVCYLNGFQTQPDAKRFWSRHPRLVLRRNGKPVVDAVWGEQLLDLRTDRKRRQLARIVGRWTHDCAARGFDAVEFDNLDSYTRSRRMLRRSQAISYARLLVRGAHGAGLAAGQKNLADLDGRRLGYDFAVAEECGRYRECGAYAANYGARVLVVEYRRVDYAWTCEHFGAALAVVLRDRDLSPHGVREWC